MAQANVSQLRPALPPQVQTSSSQAHEKNADFLTLRLVNKRARLRLSPEPLDVASFLGKASLFAVANSKGWFAAAIRDTSGTSALILSPLADLSSALATASVDSEQLFNARRRIPLSGPPPHILAFACNDTRALLGFVDGSIHVYALESLLSDGDGHVQPSHVFPSSSGALLSIQPNPGDIPELIAVLRDCTNSPGSLAVELLDLQKLSSSGGWVVGESPSTTPTSISWSPKGKQLALGLQSGDIVTFSPAETATPKFSIPHPPSANNMRVISVHWLSATSFHTIYAPLGQLTPDVEQVHFHASLDSKNNSAQDVKFSSPYLPFPGLRPPGEFLVCLRGWDPSKVLLFIGDSTSSDIGLIGSTTNESGETWYNLSLEETSTPSLPLDKDQNDTILLGMDVDLTCSDSYHHSTASGEMLDLPAHPIMYVYASDGTILGWHVLNVTGTSYPGMVAGASKSISAPSAPSGVVRELSSDMQTTPSISPTASAPVETSTTQTPPTLFEQSPSIGQIQSGSSQQPTSVFGEPFTLGQPTTTPVFGSTTTPSIFGQPSTPSPSSTVSSGGFGAFSSAGPAKFGQTTFGFGGPSQPTTSTLPPSTSTPEESMASDDTPTLTSLGLGAVNSQDSDSKPSIFGNSSVPSSSQSTDGSLAKPGAGFGAFSGFDQKSPFAQPATFTTHQPTFGTNVFQPKPESIPSTPSFGTSSPFVAGQTVFSKIAPASTFGQPAFGQSSFGQSQTGAQAFGKPSFGAVSSAAPSMTPFTSTSTGGAFSAFASGTQSAFSMAVSKNTSTKPVWAANDSSKPQETSALEKPSEWPAKTSFAIPSKAADAPTAPPLFASGPMASQFMLRDSTTKDDDSRSPSPASVQAKESASTIPSRSSPGPSAGAFSNLQTIPSAFVKPPSGLFGELPKESPFFAPPKPPESKPMSAFALSAAPGSVFPKTSFAQPTFGAPSMPSGSFKSAFPPVATTPPQPPPVSSGGAFSAFSGGGGFAAFSSGGSKTFGDLLRSAGDDKSSLSEATPTKPAHLPSQPSVTTTPAKEPPKQSSMPPSTPKIEKEEQETVEAKTIEVPSKVGVEEGKEEGEVEEGEEEEEEEEEEEASEVEESDDEYVPSESGLSEEESEVSGVAEEEIEELVGKGIEPSEVPLPVTPVSTRPPSTTPKPEFPTIAVTIAPTPQTPSGSSVPWASPVREISTTPDPTIKDIPPTLPQVQVPPLKASPPPTLPFGLAPRPNNRPLRSSPLASSPLVLDNDAEKPSPVFKLALPATAAPPTVTSPSLTPPLPKTTAPAPVRTPTPTPEQGMQAECSVLIMALGKELEDLKQIATAASTKMAERRRPSGITHQKSDLGEPGKWTFGDIEEYGRLLVDVQVDVKELKLERVSLRKALKELESNILKVNTRKEEIARFNKAKTDTEFTKMLKSRTLAPEYLEMQSQLRKSIRMIKDRIQKLEDHLQASKKRINELRTGRPGIRPPSLDTVNRTFRNIDITIDQQKQEVSQLRHRIAKLETSGGVGTRDQLTVSSPKRPLHVNPNVAITTAAALNAERSAQRLKRALLASRTQPLLNMTATASPLLTSFQTPQKSLVGQQDAKTPNVKAPESVFTLPTTPMMSFPSSLPNWSSPPLLESGSLGMYDISPSRNRGSTKHHQKPIVLKKNTSPGPTGPTTTQPSPFSDWKPVEPVKPVSLLPFAIRPTGSG